jgi:ribonucleoside-diphosphate reductase alpha chain
MSKEDDPEMAIKELEQSLVRPQQEPQLTENAKRVLAKRYLKKDKAGKPIESPADMFWRVATNIASAEAKFSDGNVELVQHWAEKFYGMMVSCKFMPNSPTLMNAGRDLQQLSACFVLPVEDSMESIFETLKHAAVIHKSGGGTGFSFSKIRPKNDRVSSTHGVASGPVSFMSVYDAATEHVKQGGTRRGANMGILRVDHPDIEEFIACKQASDNLITNFNISVAIDEGFMEKVIKDEEYDLINPRNGEVVRRVSARKIFDKIVHAAWKNGDPGIVFIDRMNAPRTNPTPHVGTIESTNPCGEQPLLPYESCNLGSVNLAKFYLRESREIDWDALEETIAAGVRFLDNVIEMNNYPVEQIARITRDGNRKIGLGVMGWADLLFRMEIPYDSDEAVELGERLMKFIQEVADNASEELARERGSFPNWKGSYYEQLGRPMRNATRTTIAPTGTISIIAGCSSGIEPLFALAYYRKVLDGEELVEIDPYFEAVARREGFYSEELIREVIAKGGVRHIKSLPKRIRDVFVTAHEIAPEWHVRHQAAFQKYTDNAVSKTVNFPRHATPEDVAKVYMLAYELGCKGVTIYRDGSKEWQVLNVGVPGAGQGATDTTKSGSSSQPSPEEKKQPEVALSEAREGSAEVVEREGVAPVYPRRVPEDEHGLPARRFRVPTPIGIMNVFVSEYEGKPFEVFIVFGKAGSDLAAFSEALGRQISLGLRCGIPLRLVVDQLKGIGGRSSIGFGEKRVFSVPDALAKLLERHYLSGRAAEAADARTRPGEGWLSGNGPVAGGATAADGSNGLARGSAADSGVDSNGGGNGTASAPTATGSYLGDGDFGPGARPGEALLVEICPECQEYSYVFEEGCGKCHSCGFSTC